MHILAIIGSGRKRGNTFRAVQAVEKRLAMLDAHLTFETLFLTDYTILPCLGCRACFDRGEAACPRRDDVPLIAQKMLAADGVIFATPSYVCTLSGSMKTLLDRLAYFCHRPAFHGKCAAVVTTTASSTAKLTAYTVQLPLSAMGYAVVGSAGVVVGTAEIVPVPEKAGKRLDRLATRLHARLASPKRDAPTIPGLTSFYMTRHYFSTHRDEKSCDYQYFVRIGWLEPGRRYYTDARPRMYQTALARMLAVLVRHT
jgi:multimeric flavodoxin WrbA